MFTKDGAENLQSLPKEVNSFKGQIVERGLLRYYKKAESTAGDGVEVGLPFEPVPPAWTWDRAKALLKLLNRPEIIQSRKNTSENLVKAVADMIKAMDPQADHEMLSKAFGQHLNNLTQGDINLLKEIVERPQPQPQDSNRDSSSRSNSRSRSQTSGKQGE